MTLTAVNLEFFLYLLNPDKICRHALTTGRDDQMEVKITLQVIPSI